MLDKVVKTRSGDQALRRTFIVDSALAAREARTRAARDRDHGCQVLSVDQAAARLAGGFLQPIPRAHLQDAIQQALADTDIGPLNPVRELPGMTRATTVTLQRAWDADLDLANGDARQRALAALDAAACARLRPSMRRPRDLADAARARLAHAPAVLGPVTVHRVPDLPPIWQPFLTALAEFVTVDWIPGSRPAPDWIPGTAIRLAEPEPATPARTAVSCANARHEAIEALRWARELIAAGHARPQDIAIAAASPADWDVHFQAMSRDANIPLHFAHGRPVVSCGEGQVCAALAEVLLNGLTQDRVRRLVPLLHSQCGRLQDLPSAWTRVLPRDAPLTSARLWRTYLARVTEWPDGYDFSVELIDLVERLELGPEHAGEVGEALLSGVSRTIWRQALAEGPADALDVTLQGLRLPDEVDPAGAIIWGPASTVAGAPRPYTRLIGVTSRAWPRRHGEDPLLPDHVVRQEDLDPVPVPERDERDFRALVTGASTSVVLSHSRRDAEGRQLGPSPLWPDDVPVTYLERARVAEHVMSEADRLLARPDEFRQTALARSTRACWRDWHVDEVTAHDGLIRANHPIVAEALARPQSTGAIQRMLRDPLGYVWRDILRWEEPAADEEPLVLDALSFGSLVHAVFQDATRALEAGPGIANANAEQIAGAARTAVERIAPDWTEKYPVPPALIWRRHLRQAEAAVPAAFAAEFGDGGPGALPDQRSLTEIPFGQTGWRDDEGSGDTPPWDVHASVQIPDTQVTINGRIDRLDLSGDADAAAVVDYKTGKLPKGRIEVRGGKEVQRCLYGFAVTALLGGTPVDARLVYPFADKALTLDDPAATLRTLADYIDLGRQQLLQGLALPGDGTEDKYNDLRFALPGDAKDRYFRDKRGLFRARLGELVDAWSLP
ncbi:PD-(D/E)XK nuclease family protein [Rhodovibrio salinarum]|nr:PD-(D/E)XK nuclease family protein [Rhodovibrio salinarum]